MEPLVSLLFIRAAERSIILLAGLVLIYLGYRLFIDGISGKSSLKAKRGDGGIELINAAPGLFFCFFGFLLLGIMSFKEVKLSFPSSDAQFSTTKAVDILLSEATNDSQTLVRDGEIPDSRQGQTSEIVLEDALEQIFEASRSGAKSMTFAEKLRLQEAYETIYLEINVNSEKLGPQNFLNNVEGN